MAFNIEVVKKHPVATGAIVVGGGVILYMLMHSGGGGGGGGAAGPSDAQVQAALQMQALTFQAGSQQSQQAFQLAMADKQMQAQLAYAGVQEAGHKEDLSVQLAAMMAQIGVQKYSADLTYQAHQADTAAALASHAADLDATYKITKLSTDALSHQSDLQAQVSMFNTGAMADIQKLFIQGNTSVQLAQTDASVKITGINADAQKYIAKKQAQSSMWGSALGFAGTALSFFSDARLKTNIKPTGATLGPNTVPIYSYKMLGVGPTRFGVMAQETMFRHPEAIDRIAGLLRVDYSHLFEQRRAA